MNFRQLNEKLEKLLEEAKTNTWEIQANGEEPPYLTYFLPEPEDNLEPYECIGAVQDDGSIYYYWVTEDGDEPEYDGDAPDVPKNILSKFKKVFSKYCQENGEEDVFANNN